MTNKLFNLKGINLTEASGPVVKIKDISAKDMAIIGISAKLAGADNIEKFWNELEAGKDLISSVPENRKADAEYFFESINGKTIEEEGVEFIESGYLKEIDKFDHTLFSLSPKEASLMDPNQRLFLESAWIALEDAGYMGKRIKSTRTGVFLGHSSDFGEEYKKYIQSADASSADIALPGNIKSIIASRISYLLDLKGPSIVIDTACSSALVAVHMACQSIRNGECDMAIAGGVKVNLMPIRDPRLKGIGIESSIERARTFDDSSDGTGMGEGVGAVLLKPLNRALDDGDYIYAVIKGSAVNQDGSSNGLTAPNPAAQEDVILRAWKDAAIDPETITYIEAHGTGTKLGDPIEISGIEKAFRNYTNKKQFCAIGAVKTNIGHLDHAAGIAGLIKAILCLKNKKIPQNLHFKNPNKKINFIESPVFINDKTTEWNTNGFPRRCGISSFGLAGTNCHVVLEEAPESEITCSKQINNKFVFPLSVKYKEGLRDLIYKYIEFINKNPQIDFESMCYTASTGRMHYNYRLVIMAENIDELKAKLQKLSVKGFETTEEQNTYYQEHTIVNDQKQYKAETEITENEKKQLSLTAKAKITELKNDDNENIIKDICQLFVKGADIEWEKMFFGAKPAKINLPVYPFMKKRCWVESKKTNRHQSSKAASNTKHPLIDACLTDTFGIEIYVTNFDLDKHWVLSEHIVSGEYVVPGTTYLEMIRKIAEKHYPNIPMELRNVMFISPLAVKEDSPKEAQIIIKHLDGHMEFNIVTKAENGSEWIKHTEGKVFPVMNESAQSINIPGISIPRINIPEIKKNAVRTKGADEYYKTQNFAITVGPRWRNIKELFYGEDEVLVNLELPSAYEDDINSYAMHPALMDNAVNPINKELGDGFYLPLTYKSMKIYGSVPKKFYSYLKRKHKSINSNETITFDVKITDLAGNVLIDIEDYAIKKVNENIFGGHKNSHKEEYIHTITWTQRKTEKINGLKERSCAVVFKDESGVGDNLINYLKQSIKHVIQVQMGTCFEKIDHEKFIINGSEEDYIMLMEAIKAQNPSLIFHLMTLNNKTEPKEIYEHQELKRKSAESIFFLTKAILAAKLKNNIDMALISNNVYEVNKEENLINPYGAALFGVGKVVGQEYSNIKCICMDIDENTSAEDIISVVLKDGDNYLTAFRNGISYVKEVSKASNEAATENQFNIKEGGTYIITGGLGGIGLEMANYLARKNKVNLIFINRTPMPAREEWFNIINSSKQNKDKKRIQAIMNIESQGSQVRTFNADVSKYYEMKTVIDSVKQDFKNIDGVIHSAGVAGDGFIIRKECETFNNVLAPKIDGAWILDKLTENENLDFFILFSSINSILSEAGQSDYTAANSYLDSFTLYRNKKGKPSTTINWAAWKDTGMAVDFGAHLKKNVFKPIGTSMAIKAFEEIMSKGINWAVIGEIDYEELKLQRNNLYFHLSEDIKNKMDNVISIDKKDKPLELINDVKVVIKGKDILDLTEAEKKVAEVWAMVLGMEEIDIYHTFNDMGGDSILATKLLNEMEKAYPNQIDITDIFTYTNIYSMANYLEQKQRKESEIEKERGEKLDIAELLEKLARGEIAASDASDLLNTEGDIVWKE